MTVEQMIARIEMIAVALDWREREIVIRRFGLGWECNIGGAVEGNGATLVEAVAEAYHVLETLARDRVANLEHQQDALKVALRKV